MIGHLPTPDSASAALMWARIGLNHWAAERDATLYIIRRDSPFGDVFTVSWQNDCVAGVLTRVAGANAFDVAKQYAELNQPSLGGDRA